MSVIGPLMDDDIWDVEAILKHMACYTCNSEEYNDWQVCLRKSSMTNLHPEYTSRARQFWYIAVNTAKYFVLPFNYEGPVFNFNGLSFAQQRPMKLSNSTLPARQRQSTLITYGMYFSFILGGFF